MTNYEPVQLAFNSIEPDGCAKNDAPVLFLHGLGASKEYWLDIPEKVAKATNRKVYVLDARNHGDSPWTDKFSFECNVDDLLSFMDSIGAPKAIIVGHSMGGITAMKLALRSPERVEKLVVEDISCRKLPAAIIDTIIIYLSLAEAALKQVPADVDEDTARSVLVDVVRQGLPQELERFAAPETAYARIQLKRTHEGRWTFKANISVLLNSLKVRKEGEPEPTGVYEGPVCFIYGNSSPFLVGKDEENNRSFFPNAKMVGIENATHTVHSDCPEDFTNTLLNFLQA